VTTESWAPQEHPTSNGSTNNRIVANGNIGSITVTGGSTISGGMPIIQLNRCNAATVGGAPIGGAQVGNGTGGGGTSFVAGTGGGVPDGGGYTNSGHPQVPGHNREGEGYNGYYQQNFGQAWHGNNEYVQQQQHYQYQGYPLPNHLYNQQQHPQMPADQFSQQQKEFYNQHIMPPFLSVNPLTGNRQNIPETLSTTNVGASPDAAEKRYQQLVSRAEKRTKEREKALQQADEMFPIPPENGPLSSTACNPGQGESMVNAVYVDEDDDEEEDEILPIEKTFFGNLPTIAALNVLKKS
jgi:hypothetical protein